MPLVGRKIKRSIVLTGLCAMITLLGLAPLSAQTEGAIAQSFLTGDEVSAGSLVGLQPGNPRTVELSNTSRVGQLTGVVADRPLIEFSDGESTIHVVTSGVTSALVSDINGDITTGDKITASPIDGVGMKSTEPELIVGTAQADLDSVETTERTLTNRDGRTKTVKIGLIPVQVHVTFHAATAVQRDFVPPFLQDMANSIAGRPVSPIRIIASILVMVLSLIATIVLLYSSVRSSIISIGRNPLSEGAIHKSLIEVGVMIVGILLLTFITIYLILVT
jgi:hypothetical protein